MYKKRLSPEEKIHFIEKYKRGEGSYASIAADAGVNRRSFRQWVRNYDACGPDVFFKRHHQRYSVEFKETAIHDYLSGVDSQDAICRKYGLRSRRQLQDWIMKYNSHEELKPSGTGGSTIVTKGRKTTFDERVSIVEDCIANSRDYALAAEKFDVSYQQVYTWVRKYDQKGIEGLKDGRGRRKPESEMNELERLRYENRMQKAQLLQKQMEIDFLKKLEELERR